MQDARSRKALSTTPAGIKPACPLGGSAGGARSKPLAPLLDRISHHLPRRASPFQKMGGLFPWCQLNLSAESAIACSASLAFPCGKFGKRQEASGFLALPGQSQLNGYYELVKD